MLAPKDVCKYLFKIITPTTSSVNAKVYDLNSLNIVLKAMVDPYRRDKANYNNGQGLECLKEYRIGFQYDIEQLLTYIKQIEQELHVYILFSVYVFERGLDISKQVKKELAHVS